MEKTECPCYTKNDGDDGMSALKYTFMNDTLFKMLFVKHPELLKKLVASILTIPFTSIEKFEIRNPEMPPESLGDKFCRLDINMEVDGQRVDLEIQQKRDGGAFPERSLYYWAREYSTALPESAKYNELPRTIVISILGFNQFPCAEYHSEFQALEVTRHTALTDKFVMHYFELPKIPRAVNADNVLELWLSLFKAETEEELEALANMEVAEMKEAVKVYHQITVTPEFRERERLYAKARHDEASALDYAKQEGQKIGEERERDKWQTIVAEKDESLADKDAEIARLRERLEKQ
ncbi:MAG: Rpn family recombination-promoting nuclease/putative transposase [Treponema sp.]|jgi:predicted transposase/invertase (TIGR01784 family)|nr:Rpn family recombination-promoting nuclease/putative transposase [Treponema sp.]